jgi:hypothetical protein
MKNQILLLVVNFFLISSVYSQLGIDYNCQDEVSEIVRDCKKRNVKKFTIYYSINRNSKSNLDDKFVYLFKNDSILKHRFRLSNFHYQLIENGFIDLNKEKRFYNHSSRGKNKFGTIKDSLGFKVYSSFLKVRSDTVLVNEYAISEGENGKVEIYKYKINNTLNISKNVTFNLSDSTKIVEGYNWINGKWAKVYEVRTSKSVSQTDNLKIVSKNSISKFYTTSMYTQKDTIITTNDKILSYYFYDKFGAINEIEIIASSENYYSISKLIPKVKSYRKDKKIHYACACCGYKTLFLPAGQDYGKCDICYWTDNPQQLANPEIVNEINKVSLRQAQKNFEAFGACEYEALEFVRPPKPEEEREVGWKKLD